MSSSVTRRGELRKSDFPVSFKLEVIQKLRENKTQREIASEMGISAPDVSRILHTRNTIITHCCDNQFHKQKRCRRGKYFDLDRAVAEWFMMAQNYDVLVTTEDIIRKAKVFVKRLGVSRLGMVSFKPGMSWFKNWKLKYRIVTERHMLKLKYGSKGTEKVRTIDASLDKCSIDTCRPEDIYTVSETSLWHKVPHETLSVLENQGNKLSGRQGDNRLTVLMSCNQDGSDKRPLLVVGKEAVPSILNLPCQYATQANSWMTSDIFVKWLLHFDKEMNRQNRKIVLVLKTSPVHPSEAQFDLCNIKLSFLHPGKKVHSLGDEGIARELKAHYASGLLQSLKFIPEKKHMLLDSLHLLSKAWLHVSSSTIQRCFHVAKLEDRKMQLNGEDLSSKEIKQCIDKDWDLKCHGMMTDEEICEKILSLKKEETSEVDSGISATNSVQQMSDVVLNSEALHCLATLRSYIEERDIKDFSLFYALETQVFDHVNKNKFKIS